VDCICFQEILSKVKEEELSFTDAELKVLGCHHAEMSARILERWEFPDMMVDGVRHHHEPGRAGAGQSLAYHIYLSDIICLMMGIGLGVDGLSYGYDKTVLEKFNLKEADIQLLFVHAVEAVAEAEAWIREVG